MNNTHVENTTFFSERIKNGEIQPKTTQFLKNLEDIEITPSAGYKPSKIGSSKGMNVNGRDSPKNGQTPRQA